MSYHAEHAAARGNRGLQGKPSHYPKFDIHDVFRMETAITKENFKKIVPIGTTVYPLIPKAVDTLNDDKGYFMGKFRSGDVRYNYKTPATIEKYIIRAGRPFKYKLTPKDPNAKDKLDDRGFQRHEFILEHVKGKNDKEERPQEEYDQEASELAKAKQEQDENRKIIRTE